MDISPASPAGREQLAQIAEQWISLWSTPVDWMLFDALHAPDFEDCASAGRAATREGFAAGLREMVAAFPDLRTVLDGCVIDVDQQQLAVRWSAAGTNRLRYLGHGPTEKLTRMKGIEVIQIRAGRIVRRWGEWDISDHTG